MEVKTMLLVMETLFLDNMGKCFMFDETFLRP